MLCPTCQAEVLENYNFCPYCGTHLSGVHPELRKKPETQEYDQREVNLAGYQIMASFRKTTGDPILAPKSIFAKYLKSPGTLYSFAVAKGNEGGERVDLLFGGLWLEAGGAISIESEDDALSRFELALEQALETKRTVFLEDEGGSANVILHHE